MLQSGTAKLTLWDLVSKEVSVVDTQLKNPSWLQWSHTGPQLAVGDGKGTLLLYRSDTRKKMSFMGKHSNAVVCGAWSGNNLLATGSKDRSITVSTADGDPVGDSIQLGQQPMAVEFAAVEPGAAGGTAMLSVNQGGKTLLLLSVQGGSRPVELAFQPSYGSIVSYRWFDDGQIVIGFSEGYVVSVGTAEPRVGSEMHKLRVHNDSLDDIAFSRRAQRIATCGGSTIKLVDASTWAELADEATTLDPSAGPISSLQWTPDGSILTAATLGGVVINYVAALPPLNASHANKLAYLTSLREACVTQIAPGSGPDVQIGLDVEPGFMAVGPTALAAGMNNRVWYYPLQSGAAAASQREYPAAVDAVKLTDTHCVVMCGGRVHLQPLAGDGAGSALLPGSEGPRVTAVAVASALVLYGNEDGSVSLHNITDSESTDLVSAADSDGSAVRGLWPNATGTRVVVQTAAGAVYLLAPLTGEQVQLPTPPPPDTTTWVWDTQHWGVLAGASNIRAAVYLWTPTGMYGSSVTALGDSSLDAQGNLATAAVVTELPTRGAVLALHAGELLFKPPVSSAPVQRVAVASHRHLAMAGRVTQEKRRSALAQALALRQWGLAQEQAEALDDRSAWLALAHNALEALEMEIAREVYRRLGDAAMVNTIDALAGEEDNTLVAGFVAALFEDWGTATALLLKSSRPVAALELHADLQQYEQALKLAETLAPSQVPRLAVRAARQLEIQGQYSQALALYSDAHARLQAAALDQNEADALVEEAEALLLGTASTREAGAGATAQPAVSNTPESGSAAASARSALRRAVHEGLTRTELRTGNIAQGMALAKDSTWSGASLWREAAAILESLKQYMEAAELYQRAGAADRAAAILIRGGHVRRPGMAQLMKEVTSSRLLCDYARAMQDAGDAKAAAAAYERAGEWDALVDLCLGALKAPERAGDIVRRTRSKDAAAQVARYCSQAGDTRGAVEFMLIAGKREEAFSIAVANGQVDTYVSVLDTFGLTVSPSDAQRIGAYFEGSQDVVSAGAWFEKANEPARALGLYLRAGEDALDKAIALVAADGSDTLAHRLVDFLTGEQDGVAKNPIWVFKLYMALGNHKRAADTALILAKNDSEMGLYRSAHEHLRTAAQALLDAKARLPSPVARQLELLHGYLLVKRLVAINDHVGAAWMLRRAAARLSAFKVHTVQVLTSAVIECQRAGYKRTAHGYAMQLMRPEYRNEVNPKFRRKIEALVRHPRDEEADTELTPCPVCAARIGAYALSCPACKSQLPMCIASGQHILAEELCTCPHCAWPARYSSFTEYLREHSDCPMCGEGLSTAQLSIAHDLEPALAAALERSGEKGGADGENDAEEGEEGAEAGSPGGRPATIALHSEEGKAAESEELDSASSPVDAVPRREAPQVSGAAAVLGALGL